MVLENKLDITDSAELARAEERISKTRAISFKRPELSCTGYNNFSETTLAI